MVFFFFFFFKVELMINVQKSRELILSPGIWLLWEKCEEWAMQGGCICKATLGWGE